MTEKSALGSGKDGMVMPADLEDSAVAETTALGNGQHTMIDEAAALGNGQDIRVEDPAALFSREEWGPIDRHADRVSKALGALWENSEQKAEQTLGKLLKTLDNSIKVQLQDVKLFVTTTMGAAGRERVAAAWRSPAEALRLLGGVLTGLSENAGQNDIGNRELGNLFSVLKSVEDLLLQACQHEEGRLPVIDEALGGTGTFGAKIEEVAKSVGVAIVLVEQMMRGTAERSRKTIAVLIAGSVVELAGVFGAEDENSEFMQRVERLRQERAGPVEGAESNEVRAFRADFGKEMERLRGAMRWRERGIWAAGLAICLLFGWALGVSGAYF
ncbi:MAG: hypothetical protein OXE76_10510 [Alphaproteobacteria bacterium]|nr:hypothetical protein [Alphaproteobacteria bacterium]